MPTQFKGTRVELSKVEIQGRATGARLAVRALFCDADGHVHAVTNHEFEPGADDALEEATVAFLTVVQKIVEKRHYHDAGEGPVAERRPTVAGIAEAIARGDNPPPDPIEQG